MLVVRRINRSVRFAYLSRRDCELAARRLLDSFLCLGMLRGFDREWIHHRRCRWSRAEGEESSEEVRARIG